MSVMVNSLMVIEIY